MALVILEKTYEFAVNQVFTGSGQTEDEQKRYILWNCKDQMISWTNNPWTVVQSSGYTGSWQAGYADYWTTWEAVLWNSTGNNHSWCVLESVGGGQLLLDCNGASTRTDLMTVKWSPEGLFGAGTTTTAPTAPDEGTCYSTGVAWLPSLSVQTWQMHMIHSTDGEIDHVLWTYNGYNITGWIHQTASCPVANYTLNEVFCGIATNSLSANAMTFSRHMDQQYWQGKKEATGDGSGIFDFGLSSLVGYNGAWNDMAGLVSGPNGISGKYAMYPIGILSDSVGADGRHGELVDQWFVPTNLPTGATLEENPLSPTYEIAVFANMAFPWSGAVPVVS